MNTERREDEQFGEKPPETQTRKKTQETSWDTPENNVDSSGTFNEQLMVVHNGRAGNVTHKQLTMQKVEWHRGWRRKL